MYYYRIYMFLKIKNYLFYIIIYCVKINNIIVIIVIKPRLTRWVDTEPN